MRAGAELVLEPFERLIKADQLALITTKDSPLR